MAEYTQKHRLLAMDSPLGEDVLLLTQLIGEEEVSSLFEYRIEMYSKDKDISSESIIGKNVNLKIMKVDESAVQLDSYYYINGFIRNFQAEGHRLQELRCYSADVVPWFWFLTQTTDCRVYQNKTVKEIACQIFSDNGFSDYQFKLIGKHPRRDYCVQYKESDYHFLTRLFEEEGIYYYFEHTVGKHLLVLGDHIGGYGTCQESSVTYHAGTMIPHTIHAWSHDREFRTGKHAKRDYDFEKPGNPMQTVVNANMPITGVNKYERYHYPGRYAEKSFGDQLTRLRVEREEAAHELIHGKSSCRSFSPGHTFTLDRHDDAPSETSNYMLLSVEHKITDHSHTTNSEGKGYTNTIRCIPANRIYRPPLVSVWPTMKGPQSAVVVGPPGEEIYTDKYGRIKIQFPWDRYGHHNENSSCWVRVSHNWAGKNWGGVFLPRIGQEVIVDFFDGDPDRPIVTGRVYNAEQMPPFELPTNKTKSGIVTRSTKGGTGANANSICFEDKKGKEHLLLHAEKDMGVEVENDESHSVGHDRSTSVTSNDTLSVGKVLKISAGESIEFICGSSKVSMDSNGSISINGVKIDITGAAQISLNSPKVNL